MSKIFCIGNSHANFFTGAHPATMGESRRNGFVSYCLGPTIAYHFYDHHLPKVMEYLEVSDIDKNNDCVMLVVGEVDCRWHLPKQAELQNRSVFEVTEECLERYWRCITDLVYRGYNVIGWGGHPSTNEGHSDDPGSPVYGDVYTRNLIGMYWDGYMRGACSVDDTPFLSIFQDLLNSDYTTKMEYYMDYCHLNERAFELLAPKLETL